MNEGSTPAPRRAVVAGLTGDRALNLLSSVIPMAGSLLCLPLVARALMPEELAIWALVITTVTAIQMLDLGISASIMKHGALAAVRGQSRRAWAYGWTGASVFAAVAVVAAVVVFSSGIADRVDRSTTSPTLLVLWGAVACVFLAPTTNCFMVLQRAMGRYRRLVVAVVCGQILFVGGVLVLASRDELSLGLLLLLQNGQFALTLLAVFVMSGIAARPVLLDREGVQSLFGFGAVMLVVNAMGALLLYAPLWVTSWRLSALDAGAFAFASTLAVAARNLPLMTLAPVINRLAATDDPYGVGAAESRRWARVILAYVAVVGAGGYLVAGPLGGAQYAHVGGLTLLLVLGYGVGTLAAVDSQVLRMTDNQRWEAISWVVSVVVLVLALPLCTILWGGWGAGAVVLLTQVVGSLIMHVAVLRLRERNAAS